MGTLGWIGLGHMGTPMATNLVAAGYKVNAYNRTLEKTDVLAQAGATILNSPKEIVEQSDVIFIMLTDGNAIRSVLTRKDGVLDAIQPGKVVVDMSTISPEDSMSFAKLVSERGGQYLDAPVSGSVPAAKGRQLVILVGGDKAAMDTCQPYFEALGKETIHFGSSGKGSSAKLTINLLLSIMTQGYAEALLFAEKSDVDKEKVIDMISKSALNSTFFQLKKGMFTANEYPSAFMIGLMSKDLGLIKAEADRLETVLPLAEVTNATFRSAKENGKAELDIAAVLVELRDKNSAKK
jgi:3-hydroxyisobutyrate dehydrogenase